MIAERHFPYLIAKILTIGSSYWIFFLFYFFLFFLILDLINFLDKKIDYLPEGIKYEKDNRAIITIVLFVVIIILGIWGTLKADRIILTEYDLETSKNLSQDYTLVLLSDIRIGYNTGAEKFEEIIEKVNAQDPDYILIAGDFFDGDWRTFYKENVNLLIKELRASKEIYMVLGNRDINLDEKDILRYLFNASGVAVLKDEIAEPNADIILIGRNPADETYDLEDFGERMGLEVLARNLDQEKFIILMDHSPNDIYLADDLGIDLQVSGHTLGGQIYPFGVITERYYPFDYGQLTRENYNLIVSSGTGTCGPPLRLGSISEIVKINIKHKVQ